MLIEILSMILRFFVARDFAGTSLLTVVPVISVIRLTFQEQPSAFLLTLPDASKTQPPPPCVGLQWQWKKGHHMNRTVRARQSSVGSFLCLSIWEGTVWNELLCRAHRSCAYCIHEGSSYLLVPLGKHPRGVWAESIKEMLWNLWQRFVYGFIYH